MQSGACRSITGAFLLLLSAFVGGSVLAAAPPAAEAAQGEALLKGVFVGPTEFTVSLEINPDYKQSATVGYVDVEAGKGLKPRYAFADMVGFAPWNTIVTFRKAPGRESGYLVRVDSDGDEDLLEETERTLTQESPIRVRVVRAWPAGPQELEYDLSYDVWTGKNGQAGYSFGWKPSYRAEGTFRYGDCERFFGVLDLDGDGVFDPTDFGGGTTIGIDRNGDGKIWGRDEWLKGDQIIEICGETFLIDELGRDASFVKFVKTLDRIPKIGDQVPPFKARTTAGDTITSDNLEGEPYLLEFWASWCKPCVAKFPILQELDRKHNSRVQVIAVNVDTEKNTARAKEMIRQYNLTWPQVMNGKGSSDPLWRTFGSMQEIRMAIPLYVLVDNLGEIQYAGSGGSKLEELASKIESVLGRQDTRK